MDFVKYTSVCIVSFLWFFPACEIENPGTLLIEDFNRASYGEWKTEGTAFNNGPSGAEDTHHMVGFLGSGFALSINYEHEPAVGTLTSPPFLIKRNSIHFLIGSDEIYFLHRSRQDSDNLAIQLLVDDKIERTFIPDEYHAMFWRSWEVSEFKGKNAQIRIIDNDDREGAHIDNDHIVSGGIILTQY